MSLYWLNLNTSKRSVTLDIAKPEGRALFEKLVATADVVVESFEPGYLDSLGLGYEALARIKPDIILTSITGFGQTGPHAHYKAPDIVGVAMGGVMWLAGEPQDPPNVLPWRQGYISASIIGAAGALTALYHRDQTGEGQHVDVSMQEALSLAQETAMQTWDMIEALRGRTGSQGRDPDRRPRPRRLRVHGRPRLRLPRHARRRALVDDARLDGRRRQGGGPHATSRTTSFIADLNLRFLTSLFQDPSKLPQNIQIMNHIVEVLRKFTARRASGSCTKKASAAACSGASSARRKTSRRTRSCVARHWLDDVDHPETGDTLALPRPALPPVRDALGDLPPAAARRRAQQRDLRRRARRHAGRMAEAGSGRSCVT